MIATGRTEDWDITLHAIDISRRGDLFVTASRWRKADGGSPQYDQTIPIRVEATDDAGVEYVQMHDFVWNHGGCTPKCDHWTVILRRPTPSPESSGRSTVSLVVRPYADASVTFNHVALPLSENSDLPEDLGPNQ